MGQGSQVRSALASNAAREQVQQIVDHAVALAVDAAERSRDLDAFTGIVCSGLIAGVFDSRILRAALDRRGIATPAGAGSERAALLREISRMGQPALRGLCVELALQLFAPTHLDGFNSRIGRRWATAISGLGVSVEQLQANAKADRKADRQARKAKASP